MFSIYRISQKCERGTRKRRIEVGMRDRGIRIWNIENRMDKRVMKRGARERQKELEEEKEVGLENCREWGRKRVPW